MARICRDKGLRVIWTLRPLVASNAPKRSDQLHCIILSLRLCCISAYMLMATGLLPRTTYLDPTQPGSLTAIHGD